MGRRQFTARATLAVSCALASLSIPALGIAAPTTLDRTVVGDPSQSYSTLKRGPGSPRIVRREIAKPQRGRRERRRSLLYFAALDELHYTDEESPGRVEYLDVSGTPFTSAWFPDEALRSFAIDRVIRSINRLQRSPLRGGDGSRARMRLALTTGDNADNQQLNEQRTVLRLLEGGRLDPNSGIESSAPCPAGQPAGGEAARYTGYGDYGDYLETDGFYDPATPIGPWAQWPAYPGLMDRAQRPFTAAGLKVPSYIALGNHDRLQQGNQWVNAAFQLVATGCVKAFAPLGTAQIPLSALLTSPQNFAAVPRDPARRSLSYPELQALFASGDQADGHGFGRVDPTELAASDGAAAYYSWTPRPGLRLVSLNTISEGGIAGLSAEGNLDAPQFNWLDGVLAKAARRGEYVVVFGHHPIGSLDSPTPDETAPPCLGVSPEPNPGCDLDPRSSSPVRGGADLEQLLLRRKNVVAYIAGHTTVNRVTPFPRPDGGGFWQIESGAAGPWPSQARLLELMDNRDGTLSLFATMVDQAAPAATPASGSDASSFTPRELASVARTLSFNDPQGDPMMAVGKAKDRNVELLVGDFRKGSGGSMGDGKTCRDNRVLGTRGNDTLRGTSSRDGLKGRRGNDRLIGLRRADCLNGGKGRDHIGGGKGNDRLRAANGRDRIRGGRGHDRIGAGKGRDIVTGGPGNDRIDAQDGRRDIIRCGPGKHDRVRADGRDVLRGCERVLGRGGSPHRAG